MSNIAADDDMTRTQNLRLRIQNSRGKWELDVAVRAEKSISLEEYCILQGISNSDGGEEV